MKYICKQHSNSKYSKHLRIWKDSDSLYKVVFFTEIRRWFAGFLKSLARFQRWKPQHDLENLPIPQRQPWKKNPTGNQTLFMAGGEGHHIVAGSDLKDLVLCKKVGCILVLVAPKQPPFSYMKTWKAATVLFWKLWGLSNELMKCRTKSPVGGKKRSWQYIPMQFTRKCK